MFKVFGIGETLLLTNKGKFDRLKHAEYKGKMDEMFLQFAIRPSFLFPKELYLSYGKGSLVYLEDINLPRPKFKSLSELTDEELMNLHGDYGDLILETEIQPNLLKIRLEEVISNMSNKTVFPEYQVIIDALKREQEKTLKILHERRNFQRKAS